MNTGISILHQPGCFAISEPSTTYHWKYMLQSENFRNPSQVPSFLSLKKKRTPCPQKRAHPPRLHPTWGFIPWSLPCSRVAEHRTMLKGCCTVLGRASEPRAGLAALRSEGRGADCTSTVRNGSFRVTGRAHLSYTVHVWQYVPTFG